jgi:hypothetical protein
MVNQIGIVDLYTVTDIDLAIHIFASKAGCLAILSSAQSAYKSNIALS